VGAYATPCFIDLDSDGLLDMITGEYDGNLNHYEQDAAGSTGFAPISENFLSTIDVRQYSAPSFTDLGNDGLLDLIVGEIAGAMVHYEQDAAGSATFTLISENFNGIDVGNRAAPCFSDLDNDGLLDMIVGEKGGNLNHYEQDAVGSTNFSLVSDSLSGIDVGAFSVPSFTDLDNDGLLDLIVGEDYGVLYHYEQDAAGSSNFTLLSDNFNTINVGSKSAPCFTDLDDDGFLDMIVGKGYGNLQHYEQDAAGSTGFTEVTESYSRIFLRRESKPAFADINGDGLEDLLVGDRTGGIHYFRRNEDTGIKENRINSLSFKLFKNYPNPFNPVTTIQYDLPKSIKVNISIYNMLSQKVRVLENRVLQAGSHTQYWDGNDEHGHPLTSGIYLCRLQAGEYNQSLKLILVR